MYQRVLICNRGLISSNCVRAVQELGGKALAVYEVADKNTQCVRIADESYPIEASEATKGYLNVDQFVNLAIKAKVDAVHPGYGFLAQDASFASKLASHRIALIAPQLQLGGDGKASAVRETLRKTATKLGLSLLPSSGHCNSYTQVQSAAQQIGYPVVVKASQGYGGRGLRVALTAEQLKTAYEFVLSQCAKFELDKGDIYVEKFLPNAKHLEIPVLRDNTGRTAVFPEVECSVQRRFQEMLVESPCPFLPETIRSRLQASAESLSAHLNVRGFCSVEFLFHAGQFYFMTINGYVPLAHAVTSALTGVDLLKEQIRLFSGGSLNIDREMLKPRSHAIAVYVNAEDPSRNFAPSPGRVEDFFLPAGDGVNVQSTVFAGDTVTGFYNPMIARVIAVDSTRQDVIAKMSAALMGFRVSGIKTNLPLLRAILKSTEFVAGNMDVSFLSSPQNRTRILQAQRTPEEEDIATLLAALALDRDPRNHQILEAARKNQFSLWNLTSRLLNRKKMEM